MRTPKIFSLFSLEQIFPLCQHCSFVCVLNGCIIYVNLNNQTRITKQSPSWGKFGGSDETLQQNTSVTMPAAGGKIFDVLVKMLTKKVSKYTNPLKEYFFYQQLKFSYFLSTNFYLLKIIIYLYFFKAWEYLDSCCKICVIF